jgi:hypothetical protein
VRSCCIHPAQQATQHVKWQHSTSAACLLPMLLGHQTLLYEHALLSHALVEACAVILFFAFQEYIHYAWLKEVGQWPAQPCSNKYQQRGCKALYGLRDASLRSSLAAQVLGRYLVDGHTSVCNCRCGTTQSAAGLSWSPCLLRASR